MKLHPFWPVLLAAALAPAAQAVLVEHKAEKKFTVPAGAVLVVDTFSGAIHVTESDSDAIEITVTQQCEAKDDKDAAPKFAALDLSLTQKDRTVTVAASYAQKVSFTWQTWPPVLLTFEIKVPRACDVDLHTRDGGITVGKLRGKLKLTTDVGKIFTGETDGTVTARSRLGDIAITACTGMIDASTGSGTVQVGRTPGGARLASGGGAIEVQAAGGDFKVSGSGSEVKVRFAHPLTHAAEVATAGGGITVIFDGRTAADVDAQAGALGKVTARGLKAAGLDDGEKRPWLTTKLNGGGPAVAIHTSGGNVLLRGEPPMPVLDAVPAVK